jgi:hypothetical protein
MISRFSFTARLVATAVVALAAGSARAGCADMPRADERPRLLRTAAVMPAERAPVSIVGLWKFSFVAHGNPSGPPDGTPIDAGFATWHADGTELMNSGRSPRSSSFCMGVWKRTGPFSVKLNHWALSWSDDGGAFVGPANIREELTLDAGGNSYHGTFSIDQYDASGSTVLGHVVGTVSATRIGVE